MRKFVILLVNFAFWNSALALPQSFDENEPEARLTGGFPSPLQQPFVVYIQTFNKSDPTAIINTCSGAIISEGMVVTSASCMLGTMGNSPAETGSVMAGSLDRTVPDPTANVQFRTIKTFIIHPSYRINSMESDIALLNLNKAFTVTATVAPIPIAKASALSSLGGAGKTKINIVGWGTNTTDITKDPTEHTMLQGVINVDVGASKDCQKQVGGNPWYFKVPSTTICANFTTGAGMCKKDSGAVAQALLKFGSAKDPVYQLVGVGSTAIPIDCPSVKQVPQFFTAVPNFAKWIQSNGGPDPQK